MSALLVLAVVSIVAFAAMRVSMHVYLRSIDQFKRNAKAKNLIRNLALIISPLIWLAAYFYPVDYGPAPRNINIWIIGWSMKTIAIFMAPAIVALLTSFYLQNRN